MTPVSNGTNMTGCCSTCGNISLDMSHCKLCIQHVLSKLPAVISFSSLLYMMSTPNYCACYANIFWTTIVTRINVLVSDPEASCSTACLCHLCTMSHLCACTFTGLLWELQLWECRAPRAAARDRSPFPEVRPTGVEWGRSHRSAHRSLRMFLLWVETHAHVHFHSYTTVLHLNKCK